MKALGAAKGSPSGQSRDGVPDGHAAESLSARDPVLAAGEEVGEYTISRLIGAGGFGTVYEAQQPVIGKRVAIKVLAHRYSGDPRAVSRFLTEARIANQIGHRNILGTFSFGQLADGRHYHVMDFVEGESLRELLARREAVPTAVAVPILRGVASALDAAHEHGVVHRDLKPANVLVAEEQGAIVPKVIDFGIAKLLADGEHAANTESGAVLGTPQYMAPEQCRGRAVDARADSYAFGILAYELLTGERPFEGEDRFELFLKHTAEQPEPPSARRAALSKAVDEIVLSLLQKDPARRPERLGTVVTALEAALQAGGSMTDSSARRRGSGAVLPSTAVAALVIAALAIGTRWLRTDSRGPPERRLAQQPAGTGAMGGHPESLPRSLGATKATRRIRVDVRGTPAGTEIVGPDGAVLGTVPSVIELTANDDTTVLTFRKTGFVATTRKIQPRDDGALEVVLARRGTPDKRGTRPGPDDFEDPFR